MKRYLRSKSPIAPLFAAFFALLVFSASAFADARLFLTYPPDVPADAVNVRVFANAPLYSDIEESRFEEEGVKLVSQDLDGSWTLKQPGLYCYYVVPNEPGKYYSVLKLVNVTDQDISSNRRIEKEILTGPMAGNGYEMCWNPNLDGLPPGKTNKSDSRDRAMTIFTDEVEALYGLYGLKGYKPISTPAFSNPRGMYQATTQEEMMDYLREIAALSPKVHLYSLGRSNYYDFDMPVLIVTTTPIPEGATYDEAAEIIRRDGKVTFWHQGQIHANETSSGEGALAMIKEMAGEYGEQYLDKVNYVVVPRFNVDGSYLWQRSNADDIDMNRDHMRLVAPMTALVHIGYLKMMPEITLDGHEYEDYELTSIDVIPNTANPVMYKYVSSGLPTDDVESTPATSLNIPKAVNDMAMDLFTDRLHKDYEKAGLNSNHYVAGIQSWGPWTVNNAIGRAYFGNMGSLSFLVETRGLGGGIWNYPRRVFSHMMTAKSIIETAYHNSDQVKATVAAGRAGVIAKGLVYDSNEKLALHQTASGNTVSPFELAHRTIDMDGTILSVDMIALQINDTVERERSRPTAYIIPKDAATVDFDRLLPLLEKQSIEYYEVTPGTSATVRQYYRVTDGDSSRVAFEAGLRNEVEVTFANGAYVVPMDQVAGTVAAMLFEPDVNSSARYDGTVAQSRVAPELISHDVATRNYPYYRLEQNSPRTVLPDAANKSITKFSIAGIDGTISETEGTIEITVPYGTNINGITPTVDENGASYTPTGAQNFTNPVTYTVTAADGTKKTYVVTVTVSPNTAKAITSFSLAGVSGVINESTGAISVTVPFGTNTSALLPAIVSTGASYSPTGAQNFGAPVTYTVTAGDGTKKTYTVTVTVAANTAKAITWFSLNSVAGTIDETLGAISLTVPFDMDITSCIPAVAFTGMSLNPALGTVQDFTNPVAYTVTAGDGTTKKYTVTVNKEQEPEPEPVGSSSSGCDAGFGLFALLMGAGAATLLRRKD